MRRSRIVGLLALLAGTASGCATATQRGDGLASIRARPESNAPAQRLVAATSTSPATPTSPATSEDHKGIFARPEGLTRFFPGLQKEATEAPRLAKAGGRSTWLGRRLRGIGQGASTPTSLTYSTAPRSGPSILRKEPGETSILPVSLTLPSDDDHARDREVTPTNAVVAEPRPEAEDKTPAPSGDEAAEPRATTPDMKPSEPIAASSEGAVPAEDASQIDTAAAPALDGANPAPPAESTVPTAPPGLDDVKPSPPASPAEAAPEVESPAPRPKETDPRERPRMAPPASRAKIVASPAGASRATATRPQTAETSKTPETSKTARSRTTLEAPKDKSASRTSTSAIKPRPKAEDPAILAARAHAATAHALGLPDPTLPSTYYRHDAPPVQGDAAVVPTTATVPGVARPDGPCPHCGHDPNWRPSLQRFGRRILGLGEFAPPSP